MIVQPGQKVPVGTVLASIAAPGAAPPAIASAPRVTSPLVRHLAKERGVDLRTLAETVPGGVVHRADVDHLGPPPTKRRPAGVRASPLARRLAASAGLDLSTVTGTGAGGAIGAADVRHVLGTKQPAAEPQPERPLTTASAETMRQAIAALMTRSNREIPHYYVTTTIDMSAANAWLHARNRDLPVAQRLVPAVLLLAATVRAAAKMPQVNGNWIDGAFRPAATVDLGLVISLRRGGILAPAIPDAATLSVEQLMARMRDLVERARTGRLRASELAPPSITVSNLGDQGVESVLGVIYPPKWHWSGSAPWSNGRGPLMASWACVPSSPRASQRIIVPPTVRSGPASSTTSTGCCRNRRSCDTRTRPRTDRADTA